MALKLGNLGAMRKAAIDALSDEQKRDRDAVFKADGDAMEAYIALLLAQLQMFIGPSPGLQTTTGPGAPTGPAPTPVTPVAAPPGGYFK